MPEIKPQKIGVAISGGWIRAAAAIGVLEVLEENGIAISMVSGCSAGCAVASVYAAGNLEPFKRRLMWGSKREYWHTLSDAKLSKNGIFAGQRAIKFWQEFLGEKEFSDLDKKLFLAASDLVTCEPVILDHGPVAEAVQAAVTIPGLFIPRKYDSRFLTDGGFHNLIPSKILYDNGCDFVIAVDISISPNFLTRLIGNYFKKRRRQDVVCDLPVKLPRSIGFFSSIFQGFKMLFGQLDSLYHSNYRYDILIKPEISDIGRLRIDRVDYLVKRGREATYNSLTELHKKIYG